MSPLEILSQHWSIIATAVSGIVAFFLLKRDVKQIELDIKRHETADNRQHEDTARRVDRIEEVNMSNSQNNAVLTTNIENLKEQFVDIKEELKAIRSLLESLLREKK